MVNKFTSLENLFQELLQIVCFQTGWIWAIYESLIWKYVCCLHQLIWIFLNPGQFYTGIWFTCIKYLWLDKNILCFRSNRDQCLTIASNNFPTQNCYVLWITKAYALWPRRVGRVIKVHLFLFITSACRAKASWHFFPVMLLILSSVDPQISTL